MIDGHGWLALLQYATVRPFYGCPEVLHMAEPYLQPSAAGAGFYAAWWLTQRIERAIGGDRRDGSDRRTP